MTVAVSGPNTEILQFDWLISGRIVPVLPAYGGFKKSCFCRINIVSFDNIWNENELRTIWKGKETMQSEVDEEILHEMKYFRFTSQDFVLNIQLKQPSYSLQ